MSKAVEAVFASSKTIPTFDNFRSAVKYILVHDNSMPELVAEEILNADADFIEGRRQAFPAQEDIIVKTADSLIIV